MALAFTTLMSCSDDNEVDLSNRKFVRIDQSAVFLARMSLSPLPLTLWRVIPIC